MFHSNLTTMVTVTAFQERTSQEGKPFYALEITSDELDLVISQQTGRYYATQFKCWISSTFTEPVCKLMLGKKMKGSIVKIDCEPYEFTVPETGEVITRNHRYEYTPTEQASMPSMQPEALFAL